MITYVRNSIFESNAQVLVNTVNTVGVMGKGLAHEFKKLYPDMFKSYQKFCDSNQFQIGQLYLYKTEHKWVLNFPTKKNWRKPSELEYIELGLQKFVDNFECMGIKSIAFPMLGCGNGGLDWSDVKPIMEKYLKRLPMDIYIHIYEKDKYEPEHTSQKEVQKWLHQAPELISFNEFYQELIELCGLVCSIKVENTEYEVTYQDECFVIKSKQNEVILAKDDLANIWHTLQMNGYINENMVSSELSKTFKEIGVFLSELEYITLSQTGDIEQEKLSLRLLAYKKPNQSASKVNQVA